MIDREKAIKGLICCKDPEDDYLCDKCPYQATKEDKQHIYWRCHKDELFADLIELLEIPSNNAPVRVEVDVNAEPYWKATCKGCKKPLSLFAAPIIEVMNFARYCPHCGRPLNWLPHIIRGMKNEL